jgi:hypothetical protein
LIDSAAYLSSFPDAHSATPVATALVSDPTSRLPSSDPIFRSLFQGGERTQPVSPAVQKLWGNSSSLTSVASASSTPAPTPDGRASLDLFSDRNGTFSG